MQTLVKKEMKIASLESPRRKWMINLSGMAFGRGRIGEVVKEGEGARIMHCRCSPNETFII